MNNSDIAYKYLEKINDIEDSILHYIEDFENDFEDLKNLIDDFNISSNKYHLKLLLHLISNISNNHFRVQHFFTKIEKIIHTYKNNIKAQLSNSEIYYIFQDNSRLLLFLLEDQILINDAKISLFLYHSPVHGNYFRKEFPHIFEDYNESEFSEKDRKIGENDHEICKLIRQDLSEEFIPFISRECISLSSKISPSIYETNPFLKNKTPSLIGYAAFFGSIEIFKYLMNNNVDLTKSLWLYAIHGNNPEIIQILEENHIIPNDETFEECIKESIICHHNELINYFENKYCENLDIKKIIYQSIISCNFIDLFNRINEENLSLYHLESVENELNDCDLTIFYYLSIYGYFELVEFLIKNTDINVNFRESYSDGNALILAVENKEIDLIKLLLLNKNLRFDIKTYFSTPLHNAVLKNNVEIVKLLLNHKNINVNIRSWTNSNFYEAVLIIAIRKNYIEIFKLLLNHQSTDINQQLLIHKRDGEKEIWEQKETPLMVAIQNENIEMIKLLLENKNIDVNMKMYIRKKYEWLDEETSALNMAVEKGNIEIIKLLLSHDNINNSQPNKDSHGETALNIAVEKGNIEIIKLLLDNPKIDPNAKSVFYQKEETALMIAISKNNIEIVKILLNHPNIDINPQPNDSCRGDTALNIALRGKNYEIVKLLLSKPNIDVNSKTIDPNWIKESSLIIAVKNKNIEIIKLLLSNPNIDINFQNEYRYKKDTALNYSVRDNNIEIVRLLLNHKNINVNVKSIDYYYEETALMIAIKKDNHEMIELLLKHPNIDVNPQIGIYGDTPLNYFIRNQNIEMVKRLLSYPNINVNCLSKECQYSESALKLAIDKNNMEIIKLLLENKNIDVNIKNLFISTETTALSIAVQNENIDLVKLLLANKNIKSQQLSIRALGKTALNIAVEKNNIEIIKLLIENPNIDVNIKSHFINQDENYEEETALMIAVKNNNIEIVKLLLNHPNIDDPKPSIMFDNDTALNIAIRNKNIEIVKLLLSNPKIDVNSQTKYSKSNKLISSLHLAIEQNNLEVVQLLLSHPNIDVNCYSTYKEKINDSLIGAKYYIEKAPIHLAAEQNNFEIMKLLLSNPKIDINSKSCYYNSYRRSVQKSALHIAIENENINILNLLLENSQTDVNLKNIYGYEGKILIDKSNSESPFLRSEFAEMKTPLYLAVEKKNAEIIQLLVKRSDLDIKCKSNFYETQYYTTLDANDFKYSEKHKEKSIFDEVIHSCNEEINDLLKNEIEKRQKEDENAN